MKKVEVYLTVVLAVLLDGNVLKKDVLMDKVECNYLKKKHADFMVKIPSDEDVTSGRKKLEWVIHNASEEGLLERVAHGQYKIAPKGVAKFRKLSAEVVKLDKTEDNFLATSLLTNYAIEWFEKFVKYTA